MLLKQGMVEVYKPLAILHPRAGCKDWKLNSTLLSSLKFVSYYIEFEIYFVIYNLF